ARTPLGGRGIALFREVAPLLIVLSQPALHARATDRPPADDSHGGYGEQENEPKQRRGGSSPAPEQDARNGGHRGDLECQQAQDHHSSGGLFDQEGQLLQAIHAPLSCVTATRSTRANKGPGQNKKVNPRAHGGGEGAPRGFGGV